MTSVEHRGGQPGVLAPGAGRGERADEAELLGGAGDLAEVVDGGRAGAAGRADRHAVPAADDVAAVAVGGQEPVEGQRLIWGRSAPEGVWDGNAPTGYP